MAVNDPVKRAAIWIGPGLAVWRAAGQAQPLIELRDVVLNTRWRTVTRAGQPVTLTAREYAILEFLALHRGAVVTRTGLYEHLFERFFRGDRSRTGAAGRTGLGLAISKAIVEAHGGTLGVSSHLGIGTAFTVKVRLVGPGPGGQRTAAGRLRRFPQHRTILPYSAATPSTKSNQGP